MTDVFGGTEQTNKQVAITDLVGEGKKYSTEQDALNSIPFSQAHITKLEGELEGLRSDLDKRLGAEEILQKVQEQRAQELNAGTRQSNQGDSTSASEGNSASTAEDIRSVVEKMNAENAVNANRQEANQYMIDTFGDKAADTVAVKAVALNMSVAQLQAVAENSPAAFKALISGGDVQQKEVVASATGQGLDSQGVTGKVPDHGTNAYYENMRKTDPKTYWQPATQNALHKQAQANPNKFFGN